MVDKPRKEKQVQYFQPHIKVADGKIHFGFDVTAGYSMPEPQYRDLVSRGKFSDESQLSWLAATFAKHFLDYSLAKFKDRIAPIDSRKGGNG